MSETDIMNINKTNDYGINTRSMKYQEIESWILSIPKFSKKNELDMTRKFYEFLGCPGSKSKVIHVAGTNGKGSVCAYLNLILMKAGFSTGMFTSPHLIHMRERIRIQGASVTESEFCDVFCQVISSVELFQEIHPDYAPTFFELLFFMGMLFYEKTLPDYIILETGLGGKLDATNVIHNPVLCILTEIGLDHMQYLGNTVELIAEQKAGIIKPGVPVVYMDKRKEVSRVIETYAARQHCSVYPVSSDGITIFRNTSKSIDFSYHSSYYRYDGLMLNTAAIYQTENAAIAIQAMEVLFPHPGFLQYDFAIREGIMEMVWEGRMEEIAEDVIIDGAHNEDGMEALMKVIRANKDKKNILLFAVVSDKDVGKMIQILMEHDEFERIYLTTIHNERGLPAEKLMGTFLQYTKKEICIYHDPKTAFEQCLLEKKDDERVYAVGSLYLAGMLKAAGGRKRND